MSVFPLSLPPPLDLEWGKQILEENPGLTEGDVLLNIKDWLLERVQYRLDEGDQNVWVAPDQVLREGSGDCEDIALLALSLSAAAGQPGRLAFFFDPVSHRGHTVAWWKRDSCCGWSIFVLEGRAPGTDPDDGLPVPEVMGWEASDLNALKRKFGYSNLELPGA